MSIENVHRGVEDIHRAIEVMLGNNPTQADREFLYKRQEELCTWRDKFNTRHWLIQENYDGSNNQKRNGQLEDDDSGCNSSGDVDTSSDPGTS